MSGPGDKVVTLAGSQPIDPARVEGALAELWREASTGGGANEQGQVSRACLWNMVVYNPKPQSAFKDAAGHGYGLRGLLDEVILSTPARIIRLEFTQDRSVLPPGKEAAAWVAAKCLPHPQGIRQIHGEEINLSVHGEKGDTHFPSLVRALLQPNLPIALLWLDDIPHKGWLLRQLLDLSDRILVDSQSADQESDLAVLQELAGEARAAFVDIGWMRLTPLRYLLAGFFDPPARTAQLAQIERIAIEATPAGKNAALLLLGWFLERCGYRKFRARNDENSEAVSRWIVEDAATPLEAHITLKEGEGGADELLSVEISAGGDLFTVRQEDRGHVAVDCPDRQEARVPLHGWSDPELVVAALGAQGIDPIYPKALATAAALIDAEAWSR